MERRKRTSYERGFDILPFLHGRNRDLSFPLVLVGYARVDIRPQGSGSIHTSAIRPPTATPRLCALFHRVVSPLFQRSPNLLGRLESCEEKTPLSPYLLAPTLSFSVCLCRSLFARVFLFERKDVSIAHNVVI